MLALKSAVRGEPEIGTGLIERLLENGKLFVRESRLTSIRSHDQPAARNDGQSILGRPGKRQGSSPSAEAGFY